MAESADAQGEHMGHGTRYYKSHRATSKEDFNVNSFSGDHISSREETIALSSTKDKHGYRAQRAFAVVD